MSAREAGPVGLVGERSSVGISTMLDGGGGGYRFFQRKVRSSEQIAPTHILDVVIPGNLIDLLQPPTQYVAVIKGELELNTGTNHDISQPTPMGELIYPWIIPPRM